MDHLLNLPFDVLRVGIFPLLTEKDISILDISVSCQLLLRDLLWEALRFSQFDGWTRNISLPKLEWLHARGIRLCRIDSTVCHKHITPMLHLIQQVCPSPQRLLFGTRRGLYRKPLSFDFPLLYPVCGSHLTSFRLSNCSNITKRALTTVLRDSPNLKYVNLSHNTLSSYVVTTLSHFPQLAALDLGNCEGVTDDSIVAIAENCPHLTFLRVTKSLGITDKAIVGVATHCAGLTKLDLIGCRRVTDISLCALADRCPLLTCLGVGAMHCYRITDVGITAIANKLPITQLLLRTCMMLTDAAILSLAEKCHLLTILDLTGCFKVTNASMIALSRHCPLTHLRIAGNCSRLTGDGIMKMSLNMPNLISLHICGCLYITDYIIATVTQNLPRLVHLRLSMCNRVSPVGLLDVGTNCRSLENLDISLSSRLVGYGAADSLIACIGNFSSTLKTLNVGTMAFQVNVWT